MSQNRSEEAEAAVRQAMKLAPDNASGYLMLGSMLDHQGKRSEAEALYRRALKLDPANSHVLNNLGYMMLERNQNLDEAFRMIQKAVEAQPRNSSFLDSLGWAYFKLGRLDEAEQYLSEAARVSESPTVQEHLGDVYQQRGKTEQARAVWQKALKLSQAAEQTSRLKTKLGVETKK